MESGQHKIGLALSGGGFRAALFHLGVIRFLHDAHLLERVGRIASVSGGSIVAAHLALHWEDYNKDFDTAAQPIIRFFRTDIRGRVVRRWIFSWLTVFPRLFKARRWTFTNLLQTYYRDLFSGARLDDLTKYESQGVPEIYFNCASLGTGTACCFGRSRFMWLDNKSTEQAIHAPHTRIDFAVAASSAFPPLFPPIAITNEALHCGKETFPNAFYLTDGGIFDNLGIDRLIRIDKDKADTSIFIISDAEGNFPAEFDKQYTFLISRNVRASNFLMTRVSALQIQELGTLQQTIAWIRIKDEIKGSSGSAFLPVEFQRAMCDIRTDLDRFLPEEITALIAHGYAKARSALIEKHVVTEDAPPFSWDPLRNWHDFHDPLNFEYLSKKLNKASQRQWRLWSSSDVMSWLTALVVAVYAALAIFVWPTALIALAKEFPHVLPFWAPFDANVAVRDLQVENASLLNNSMVQTQLQFVAVKTGSSVLSGCTPQLQLKDELITPNEKALTIGDPTNAFVQSTFVFPKEEYTKDGASFRLVCKELASQLSAVKFPDLAGVTKPTITDYLVCLGQYPQACAQGLPFIPCGGNVANWAKEQHPAECVNVSYTKLTDVGGNQCGYATFRVLCSSTK